MVHADWRQRTMMAYALAASAAILPSRQARADEEPTPIDAHLMAKGENVAVSFDVTMAFTEGFRKRLDSGLTNRAVIEMTLLDTSGHLLASVVRQCKFLFDIWDGLLELRIRDGAKAMPPIQRKLKEQGLVDCGRVEVEIANLALFERRTGYHLEVEVALNPVSDEQVQRAREFMANPKSGQRSRSPSFFGAVARLFGGEDRPGEETFRFRSAALDRPLSRPKR